MEHFNKHIAKDRAPDDMLTINEVKQENQALVERAVRELEILAPTLRDVVERIRTEAPDVVVFLDKGARILATPLKKYLSEIGVSVPEIKFYNDSPLKGHYLMKEDDQLEAKIKTDFQNLVGKKVFFIDETFSAGKGAVTLRRAIDLMHLDAKYFALSRDPTLGELRNGEDSFVYYRSWSDHSEALDELAHDSRFKIYDNNIDILFTKVAAKLYITESVNRETMGRYKPIVAGDEDKEFDYTLKEGRLPHARTFSKVPEKGMGWIEYDQNVRELNMATAKTLKDEIYKAFKGE